MWMATASFEQIDLVRQKVEVSCCCTSIYIYEFFLPIDPTHHHLTLASSLVLPSCCVVSAGMVTLNFGLFSGVPGSDLGD